MCSVHIINQRLLKYPVKQEVPGIFLAAPQRFHGQRDRKFSPLFSRKPFFTLFLALQKCIGVQQAKSKGARVEICDNTSFSCYFFLMGRGADSELQTIASSPRLPLKRESDMQIASASSLYHGREASIDDLLWYFSNYLEDGGEGDPLTASGRALSGLLASLPREGEGLANRFVSRYRLLLARDLLRASPALMNTVEKALEDFRRDILRDEAFVREEDSEQFRQFFQALLADDLEVVDLLRAGQEAGLDIAFPEEGNDRFSYSISVDGEEFFLFRAQAEEEGEFEITAASCKPPGVGANRWQTAPMSRVLATITSMSEVEEELNAREAAKAISLGSPGSNLGNFLRQQAPALLQFSEVLRNHARTDFANRLYGIERDLLAAESKTDQCAGRLEVLDILANYADLRHTVEAAARELEGVDENDPALSEEERADLKKTKNQVLRIQAILRQQYLSEQIDLSLEEARKKANQYLDAPAEDILPSAYLHFQNFSDAVESLHRSQNLNSAALWAYCAEIYGSDDPELWRQKKMKTLAERPGLSSYGDSSLTAHEARLIYGGLLVEQDPKSKKQFEHSYEEEEDLRLRAHLLGAIPDKELIYMPSPEWVGSSSRNLAGQHDSFNPARPSFVFIPGSSDQWRRSVVVHELLHAGQRVDSRTVNQPMIKEQGVSTKDANTVMLSLDEALTETLTQVRVKKSFAENTNVENIPGCAYTVHVKTLLQILDQMGIAQEDRETALQELALMSGEDRIRKIAGILEKRGVTGSVMSIWLNSLASHLGGSLNGLSSYFRS